MRKFKIEIFQDQSFQNLGAVVSELSEQPKGVLPGTKVKFETRNEAMEDAIRRIKAWIEEGK